MLHRNDDVARQRQLTATAQREAVHGGDHWLGHPEPLGQSAKTTRFEREPVRLRRAFSLPLLQVGTSAERLVTLASQDGHPRIIIFLEASPGTVHLGVRGQVQGVADLRATDGEGRHSAVLLLVIRKELELVLSILCGRTHADTPTAMAGIDAESAGSASGPSNAPRSRRTAWISATSSWRGDVWWRTASAAATPAASPTTNIGGISRLIFCASEVAEKQRPATSRFSTPTGSR